MEWLLIILLFISVIIYSCFHTFPMKTKMVAVLFSMVIAIGSWMFVNLSEEKWALAFSDRSPAQVTKDFTTTEQDSSVYEMIKIHEQVLLQAPIISQFPELVRGCEVTSLAMLLQFHGYDVDKLLLAEQITKDTTPYEIKNGQVTFGHPNKGFVGDMYSYQNPGLGVYHKPIVELAKKYAHENVIDFTGSEFSKVKMYLGLGMPVWVITNTTYQKLPPSAFETWNTSEGDIDITYKEHSVLLTGYDEQFVYFNDPLTGTKNKKAPIDDFIQSWTQMGSQAVTINLH